MVGELSRSASEAVMERKRGFLCPDRTRVSAELLSSDLTGQPMVGFAECEAESRSGSWGCEM
jgi:hypothetical protein